jgi:hypothetical protein
MSESYIYAIYCKLSNRVKIGWSNNPHARLEEIQIHSPTTLELLGYIPFRNPKKIAEPILHKLLNNYRLHGEWFDCSDNVQVILEIFKNNDKQQLSEIINKYQWYGVSI